MIHYETAVRELKDSLPNVRTNFVSEMVYPLSPEYTFCINGFSFCSNMYLHGEAQYSEGFDLVEANADFFATARSKNRVFFVRILSRRHGELIGLCFNSDEPLIFYLDDFSGIEVMLNQVNIKKYYFESEQLTFLKILWDKYHMSPNFKLLLSQ